MYDIRTDIHAANKNKVAIFPTESQPLASFLQGPPIRL